MKETGERIPHRIKSKEIIILEGYFALLKEEIRELCDTKIYLDIPIEKSLERREKPVNSQEYKEKVLISMTQKHVEPTKKYADKVIDTEEKSKQEVIKEVEETIMEE